MPLVVVALLVSLAAALLVALIVQRVDADLVWFASPVIAGIGMALAEALSGSRTDSIAGALIRVGASVTVPFLAGWADASESDFHRFLRRFPLT
jgi:type II secretory pathway pseudopilin PulG